MTFLAGIAIFAPLAWLVLGNLPYWLASPAEREVITHGKPVAEMTEEDWLDHASDRSW